MKKTIIGAIAIFIAGGLFATAIINMTNNKPTTEVLASTTETEATTEGSVQTTTQAAAENSYMPVEYVLNSQWQAEGNYCYGYTIPINNISDKDIENWKAEIEFSSDVEIIHLWNGNYSTLDNVITVTPVDYNKAVLAGGNIDFGFNCQTSAEAVITSIKLYENNEVIGMYAQEEKNEGLTSMPESSANNGATPVEKYGKLSVSGTNIVGADGKPVVLQGVSTHGIGWFPQYVNKDGFQSLRDNMNVDLIRLALYSSEGEAYSTNLHTKVKEGVQYATELGMYAIIDWHILSNGNPNTDKAKAVTFFTEMAQAYAQSNNVIYEICNEPNGDVQWERDIKPYAEELISVIRKYDNDAIIIVGTPTWSQDVDVVAQSPITGQENIMYALHFYAATHTDSIRNKLTTALASGLPVIVSEFGICDASGNGSINEDEAQKWLSLLRDKKVSYVAWNLSNKNESSALISSGCTKTSGWSDEDLSQSGKWIKKVYNS